MVIVASQKKIIMNRIFSRKLQPLKSSFFSDSETLFKVPARNCFNKLFCSTIFPYEMFKILRFHTHSGITTFSFVAASFVKIETVLLLALLKFLETNSPVTLIFSKHLLVLVANLLPKPVVERKQPPSNRYCSYLLVYV